MNEFSILCRVLGTLYYRQPQDPLLVPLFTLIREGKLAQSWPLEQDELLERLQKSCDMQQISTDYNALFVGKSVACRRIVLPAGRCDRSGSSGVSFRTRHAADGYACRSYRYPAAGGLRIEDNAGDDENEAIETLFETYLLPWVGTFPGKVEAHATSPFWRTLAPLTRDAIAAMWDELEEENEE